jgi:hypothetical protein
MAEVRGWVLEAGLVPTADRHMSGRLFPPKGLAMRACKLGRNGGSPSGA